MKTEYVDVVTKTEPPPFSQQAHMHPDKRSWPWLVAAFLLCPCHLPIVLAVLGTGAFGGVIARSQGALFVVLEAAFGFALWRGLSVSKKVESCPGCREERR
ncbi:MAG: hypothetical protein H0W55_08770 [Actinobacteria bacterium]|nr:hypothetical protein [Actinomycetota bacterium]MDQ3532289.1 hypothetical protein [Actinomycetota bacterium]